jgi:hypothetical protein
MRLACDQAHQTTAALATMRRQLLHFFEFDLLHAAHAMPQLKGVNSVSLQPLFVLTPEFGRVRH